MEENKSKGNIISALTLDSKSTNIVESKNVIVKCLKCEETFEFPLLKDEYLAHLYCIHRLVIAEVEDIADLVEYLQFWNQMFEDKELAEYCTTLLMDQLPDGTFSKNEKYYLLSDVLPKDYELRKALHSKRLENVLSQHQFDRTDRNFSRECLYCRDVITGLRCTYLEHLFTKHFLQIGKPENLVFVDELIDIVQTKLENLTCLFCEKVFKDRSTLKEHMRKKGHKRINPNIKLYDKYFLVNYKIEKPKRVKNIKQQKRSFNMVSASIRKQNESQQQSSNSQPPSSNNQQEALNNRQQSSNNQQQNLYNQSSNLQPTSNSPDSDTDWSDWDGEIQSLTCLFCSTKDSDFANLKAHMILEHHVDFDKATKSLNFYQKIKVVNYIRRQIHILRCITCDMLTESLDQLLVHMQDVKHFGIGAKNQWDHPEFFFPTYEDDGVLCLLDDHSDNDDFIESTMTVLPEDRKGNINKDAEQLSLENFQLL